MRRTIVPALLLSLSAREAIAIDQSGEYTVKGLIGCGSYVALFQRDRAERGGSGTVTHSFAQISGWIRGYLTSYNAWTDNGKEDIAKNIDGESVELWISNYCNENPLRTTSHAMQELIIELESQ